MGRRSTVRTKKTTSNSRSSPITSGRSPFPSVVGPCHQHGPGLRHPAPARRAVVAGKKLGIDEPFLAKMVPTVGKIMQDYYPDVLENADYIASVIKSEEDRFSATRNGD